MASLLACLDCGREIEMPVDVGPRLVACPDCGQDLRIIPSPKKPPVHRSIFCSECGNLADLPLDFVGRFSCPKCRVELQAPPRRPAAKMPRAKPNRKQHRNPGEFNDDLFAAQGEIGAPPSRVKPFSSQATDHHRESPKATDISDEQSFEHIPVIRSIIGSRADDSPTEPHAFVQPLDQDHRIRIRDVGSQMDSIRKSFMSQFRHTCRESDLLGLADWGDMLRVVRPLGWRVEAVVDLSIKSINRALLIESRAYCQKRRHIVPFILLGSINEILDFLVVALGASNNNKAIRFHANRRWITHHRLSSGRDFASEVNGIMREVLEQKGIAAHDQLTI